ncbi:hypothetical protein B0T22DRAFT_69519 [Podospora appendiculata]|uniref:Ankyrin n=1 Tax=Podospora appendiculata TaxID=314037 RepID=A0AAE0XJ48_9PEZI|nr:hypothetical protein B0T22DRAFT_69519 [Podospora appendiculata]
MPDASTPRFSSSFVDFMRMGVLVKTRRFSWKPCRVSGTTLGIFVLERSTRISLQLQSPSLIQALLSPRVPESRITELIDLGFDLHALDTPIMIPVERRSHTLMSLFLEAGTQVHITDAGEVEEGWDNLEKMCAHALQFHLDDFKWAGSQRYHGETRNPVLRAIRLLPVQGGTMLVDLMLQAQPLTMQTPGRLHFEYLREACRFLDRDLLRLMLRHGANAKAAARDGTGHTALWWVLHHRDEILGSVFETGIPKPVTIDPDKKMEIIRGGNTWLKARLLNIPPWVQCVETLLRAGCDPNVINRVWKADL